MLDKKRSLSVKSTIMLVILGFILFIGTGLAGGIHIYEENLETVRAFAESYAYMLRFQITDIDRILQSEQEIRDLVDDIFQHDKKQIKYDANGGAVIDEETFQKSVEEKYDAEVMAATRLWTEVDTFVYGFGNICKDIRYAYVVVPEENDLIYIWDSDAADYMVAPFNHKPYSGKEKEHIEAVMRGDAESDFFMETVGGELIGTTLVPVSNDEGKIRAVAAIDISVSGVRAASLSHIFHIGIIILLIMLVSITVYHYIVRKQIIDPVKAISERMTLFAKDSRKKPEMLNIRSRDEIGEIAESFEKMTEDISTYVSSIETLTMERVQNNVELEVARRIQNGLVPEQYSLEDEGYRIRAMTRPARAVGGDFYDCFLLDENSVCIFMGDVSGKGISAAIFMAMTKTIIREKLFDGLGPAAALNQANNELYKQNPEFLFATVFAAVLNLKTGELRYANAGHTLPILLKKEQEYLHPDSGIALGVLEDAGIREDSLWLAEGEGILLYTDGVTETMNMQKDFFGMDRLLDTVRMPAAWADSEDDVLVRIRHAVNRFSEGCEPFDDMTALALYRTGDSTCALPVDLSSLDKIRKIVLASLGDTLEASGILLVCDEVLSNIVSYSGATILTFSCKKMDNELWLSFTDNGIPFDPTIVKEKRAVEEMDQGGMGLIIVRQSVSSLSYKRKDGRNELLMSFRLGE